MNSPSLRHLLLLTMAEVSQVFEIESRLSVAGHMEFQEILHIFDLLDKKMPGFGIYSLKVTRHLYVLWHARLTLP